MLYSDVMRTRLLIFALLFSSLGVVAQAGAPPSPSSKGATVEEAESPAPSTPGTAQALDACGVPKVLPEISKTNHISGGELIKKVNPNYPADLRRAHIEGTIVMCAKIGKDGKIQKLRAVSGPPELVPSAMEAAKQWLYKPYKKNKEPIDVDSEIRMDFRLSR